MGEYGLSSISLIILTAISVWLVVVIWTFFYTHILIFIIRSFFSSLSTPDNYEQKQLKTFSDSDICQNEVAHQEKELVKQNTRTLMQALHGCLKNCRECRENEADYEDYEKEVTRE